MPSDFNDNLSTSENLPNPADLQCSICLDFYNEPLTLSCKHSFCRLCLLQSTRLAPDGRACPQCRAPITNIQAPLTHPADQELEQKIEKTIEILKIQKTQQSLNDQTSQQDNFAGLSFEARSDRRIRDLESLQNFANANSKTLPVFYMNGKLHKIGELIQLNFFEPRYRILIRRCWEGEKSFLYATQEPKQGVEALLVKVDTAQFENDGKASIKGRGVEIVSLTSECWVEQGTGGLWYAKVGTLGSMDSNNVLRDSSQSQQTQQTNQIQTSTSSNSNSPNTNNIQSQTFNVTTVPQFNANNLSNAQVIRRIQSAINEGAPAYNQGRIEQCARLYIKTAKDIIQMVGIPLQNLNNQQQQQYDFGGLIQAIQKAENEIVNRRSVNSAAWTMRHAFDKILRNPNRMLKIVAVGTTGQQVNQDNSVLSNNNNSFTLRSSAAAAAGTQSQNQPYYIIGAPVSIDSVEFIQDWMPIFCFNGLNIKPNETASYTMFEPRYRVLAQMVNNNQSSNSNSQNSNSNNSNSNLFLTASTDRPRAGNRATLVSLESCQWESGLSGNGSNAKTVIRGINYVDLIDTYQDQNKNGLWFGKFNGGQGNNLNYGNINNGLNYRVTNSSSNKNVLSRCFGGTSSKCTIM